MTLLDIRYTWPSLPTNHPQSRKNLHVLRQEVQHNLVPPPVLLLDLGVLEVRPGGHPPVDLVREGLDVLGDLEAGVEALHGLGVLVLGGEEAEGDLDLGAVGRVDHGGVAGDGGGEGGRGGGCQRHYLAAPAVLELC